MWLAAVEAYALGLSFFNRRLAAELNTLVKKIFFFKFFWIF